MDPGALNQCGSILILIRNFEITYLLLGELYPVRHVGGQQIRPCEVVVVSHHVLLLLHWSPVLGLALGLSKIVLVPY